MIVVVARGVRHPIIIMGGPLAYGGDSMLVQHLWVTRWKGGSGAGTPAGTLAAGRGSRGCFKGVPTMLEPFWHTKIQRFTNKAKHNSGILWFHTAIPYSKKAY